MKISWKTIGQAVGAIVASAVLVITTAIVAVPAVSQIAGLAVAQSSTNWNSVIDASRGDSQSSGILGTATYLFNGLTFDRLRGTSGSANVNLVGAITPADAYANPTTASQVWALNGLFNGTTWDRIRSATADALASTGLTAAGNMVFNGTTWDRWRSVSIGDGVSTGVGATGNFMFNGTSFNRQREASGTNNTATTLTGVAYSTQASTWSVIDTDVGATQSTATRAAGGGTVRHVATGVTICRGDTAVAAPALVHLRDGATGAGTILRSWVIGVSVANESKCENVTGLNMTGSANTAMTLEFAAAGAASSTSTVSLTGYSTP